MAYDADQELRLIIKTIYDPQGSKASLGDLRILVEATQRGSKEAADALDHWRKTFGRLKEDVSSSGGVLATDPSSAMREAPEQADSHVTKWKSHLHNQDPVQNQSVLRRLAAIAGFGSAVMVTYRAISMVVDAMRSWFQSIDEMERRSRAYEDVSNRVEGIASKTRQAEEHNRGFAMSYEDLSRQVHSTAAELSFYSDMLETTAAFEQRKDRAETDRRIKQIDWDQRFNPLERIKQTEAEESAYFERQMRREEQRRERKLQELEFEKQLAAAREERFATEKEETEKAIIAASRKADIDEARAAAIEQEDADRIATLEKERQLVARMASGKFGSTDILQYQWFRAKVNQELSESSMASDILVGSNLTTTDSTIREYGNIRLGELDDSLQAARQRTFSARDVARQSRGRLGRLERLRGIQEDEVLRSQAEQQKVEMEEMHQKKMMDMEKPFRQSIESDTLRGMEINRDLQIQQQLQSGARLGANGATLDDVVRQLEAMNARWA